VLNENAQRWVAALRSGEYTQTTGRLRNGDAFCCLGVACDLFDSSQWTRDYDYEFDRYGVPDSVRDSLGLRDNAGANDNCASLAYHNDTGSSFADIADIIESEPPGLFRAM